jgi:hypothetical protein
MVVELYSRGSQGDDASCRICAEMMCAILYQLVESCGHQVVRSVCMDRGRTKFLWLWVKIRSPDRNVYPTLVDCKAFWLFSEEGEYYYEMLYYAIKYRLQIW